uniref:Uncharacterized protein n=1 Tax=Rhizophora mucronata TaxID=61149 RepID=A0A2P2KNH4_RHIMU
MRSRYSETDFPGHKRFLLFLFRYTHLFHFSSMTVAYCVLSFVAKFNEKYQRGQGQQVQRTAVRRRWRGELPINKPTNPSQTREIPKT